MQDEVLQARHNVVSRFLSYGWQFLQAYGFIVLVLVFILYLLLPRIRDKIRAPPPISYERQRELDDARDKAREKQQRLHESKTHHAKEMQRQKLLQELEEQKRARDLEAAENPVRGHVLGSATTTTSTQAPSFNPLAGGGSFSGYRPSGAMRNVGRRS
eukprot:GILK01004233.1.p1 GENE.GILK01004233.1~~GILK01004233.1.p1  ORF type:complete len:169 (-),score=9.21 GILK01004233.1:205-678(-)